MPRKTNKIVVLMPLVALTAALALPPVFAQAPGAFVESTEQSSAPINGNATTDPHMYQGAPQYYDPNMGGQYAQQPVYQGNATMQQMPQQMPQMQMPMQQPTQMPMQQPVNPAPQPPAAAAPTAANDLPSEFPTLDELKQTFAQDAQKRANQAAQNGQMGGQVDGSQQPHSTAGGIGSMGASLLKAVGSMAGPTMYGTRPMGMGMGMPGMGMGGLGGMGMGMPGMGMGGLGGMGMGNPFAPRQSMMNSIINQSLYSGSRLFTH